MAIGKPLGNLASDFNSVYNITLDVSGWDKTTIHVVAPISGTLVVYGSCDAGAGATTQGNASLAANFNLVQATNLATGAAVNTIAAAGTYKVDNNNQFLRLQGAVAAAGTSVYKLFLFNQKID